MKVFLQRTARMKFVICFRRTCMAIIEVTFMHVWKEPNKRLDHVCICVCTLQHIKDQHAGNSTLEFDCSVHQSIHSDIWLKAVSDPLMCGTLPYQTQREGLTKKSQ